jgi:hypothetical protein
MLQALAAEFAEITEQLLETLWTWKIERDSEAKDRLWQQLVVLHEIHRNAFNKVSSHMAAETEKARIISKSTVKRHVDWGKTNP